jgi:N-acetylglucosaminyldiphosphoundecaprenol N-acetyl-beta-D-mannosaminyltransferase
MITNAMIPPVPSRPAVQILGLPIHIVDMPCALEVIDGFIQARSPHHIITADASMLVMAQQDAVLRGIIVQADLVTPDSTGILWAARRHGTRLRERVSGVEIVEQLCAASAEKGYRLYFLGAAPGIAEQAAERMRRKYPGAQIVGTRNGYFTPEDTAPILAEIRACAPDILCVALGIPKQEKWIATHREQLGVPVLIGVGGTLDVLSGTVRRAPRLFQLARLEWLWRVLSNPRKIGKVMLLPRFVVMVQRARTAGSRQ